MPSSATVENQKSDIKLLHEIIRKFQISIDEMQKDPSTDPAKLFDVINHKSKTHELLQLKIQQLHIEEARERSLEEENGISPTQIAKSIGGRGFVDIRFGLRTQVPIPGALTYGEIMFPQSSTKKLIK